MHYIIYHQVKPGVDCPDGIAAAWVVHRALPRVVSKFPGMPTQCVTLLGWTYQQVKDSDIPPLEPGDVAFIVDFSFPKEVLQEWEDNGVIVTLIDHHETAQRQLDKFMVSNVESFVNTGVAAIFDMSECGATLTWKTLNPSEPMPVFLEYVKDRDLWDWLLPETPEVHEAMSTLRYGTRKIGGDEFELFKMFDGLAKLNREELLALLMPIGQPLVAPKRKKVEEIAARAMKAFLAEHRILCVQLNPDGSEDRYVSDVCMKMYRDNPEFAFVASVTSDGSLSLRSDKHGNNFDVGSLAEKLGGGGHRNAAGVQSLPSETFFFGEN